MVKIFDHLAKLKYSPVNPTAFTERGLYMLATILKGRVATQTTINIINTFVEIRELSRAIARVPEVVDENEKKSLLKRSGEIISNVLASDSTSLAPHEKGPKMVQQTISDLATRTALPLMEIRPLPLSLQCR